MLMNKNFRKSGIDSSTIKDQFIFLLMFYQAWLNLTREFPNTYLTWKFENFKKTENKRKKKRNWKRNWNRKSRQIGHSLFKVPVVAQNKRKEFEFPNFSSILIQLHFQNVFKIKRVETGEICPGLLPLSIRLLHRQKMIVAKYLWNICWGRGAWFKPESGIWTSLYFKALDL